MEQHHYDNGFITLISVLIACALGTAIAFSVVLLGVNFSKTSLVLDQSYKAKALADACAEEGLQQIRSSTAFAGTGNLSLGQGSCTYTVVNTGAENRTVTATGTVGTVIRKVSVSINKISPKLVVTSWQETAN